MVVVSPTPSDVQFARRPVRKGIRILRAVGKWIQRVAGRIPGEYTIAKLDALNRFREHTTSSWMITILFATPIPCFLTSLIIERIPLTDPATGFWGSLHFQIRNYLTATIMTAMPVFMKFNCIPQLSTRSWKFVVGYGMTAAAVAIANNALISLAAGVFPIPFTQFAPTLPMAMVGGLLNRFFLRKPEVKERAEKIDQWLAMDMVPICVYPIFTAVFMALRPSQQLWLSLLLPVIKRLLRQIIWWMMREDLDLVGPTTCSVGHLYHILFTAMCLQNAKSLETLAAIIMVNTLQMLLNCRDIMKDATNLHKIKPQLPDSTGDVVINVLLLAQQQQVSKSLHRKLPTRIFSKYPGYQTIEFMSIHHKLLQKNEPSSTPNDNPPGQNFRRGSRYRSLLSEQGFTQIIPLKDETVGWIRRGSGQYFMPTVKKLEPSRARTVPTMQPKGDRTIQSEMYIRNATSALHQTEIILLRSYITIFVLSFYGIYLVLVFWLPNRKYFATMSTMTTFDAVDSMIFHLLLLGSIEMIFLVMYLVLISHQLGVSGLHQLAFVLWSQRVLLQSKFMSLSLMILGFPLEHYGNGIIYR